MTNVYRWLSPCACYPVRVMAQNNIVITMMIRICKIESVIWAPGMFPGRLSFRNPLLLLFPFSRCSPLLLLLVFMLLLLLLLMLLLFRLLFPLSLVMRNSTNTNGEPVLKASILLFHIFFWPKSVNSSLPFNKSAGLPKSNMAISAEFYFFLVKQIWYFAPKEEDFKKSSPSHVRAVLGHLSTPWLRAGHPPCLDH